jgi:DNA replication initiation complex subunit (GINS family)
LIADCAAVRDFPRISVPDIKKGLMILLQYEELRQTMEGMRPELSELGEALGLDTARSEVSELEQTAAEQGFWDDMEKSQKMCLIELLVFAHNERIEHRLQMIIAVFLG